MSLSNKAYDVLKWIALVLLPALAALYIGLASLWHLPNPEGVAGTVSLVDTFLGIVLHLNSNSYAKTQAEEDEENSDGDILHGQVDGEHTLTLGVKGSVEALVSKDKVSLNIVHLPSVDKTSSQPKPMP